MLFRSLVEQPPQSPDKADAVTLTDAKGNVTMQNVAFSYVKDRELIKSLNLNVKAGSRIAIVGPTGCGKTTLINLLMRFYDVDGGVIAVDGIEINDITRSSLRRSYGMVLQDTWLKDGTVRENIAMGKPDATDEELWQALGHATTLAYEPFPAFDPKALVEDEIEIPVQVLGKLRGTVIMPVDSEQDAVVAEALKQEKVAKFVEGKNVVKVILVRNKLVNLIVKPAK